MRRYAITQKRTENVFDESSLVADENREGRVIGSRVLELQLVQNSLRAVGCTRIPLPPILQLQTSRRTPRGPLRIRVTSVEVDLPVLREHNCLNASTNRVRSIVSLLKKKKYLNNFTGKSFIIFV